MSATLSVVIPALNEAELLPGLLQDLDALDAEIIVVDGASTDDTASVAHEHGARLVSTASGRGHQLRAGAAVARGDWVFFVHADCRLDPSVLEALRSFISSADERDFAHFRFGLDRDQPIHRFVEFGQRVRERWLGLVYGDQGLVVSSALYREAGGYPDWPVMEDVEIIARLERVGRRVALPATLVTSARRYDEEGGLRRWARNVSLMVRYRLGADPVDLAPAYAPRAATPPPPLAIVGVFAKVPTPGRVKTRLAASVGPERAAQIYRYLGRRVADGLRGGPYRLVVFVDPPDPTSLDAARLWLGGEGLEVRPQPGGDLGERMAHALAQALGQAPVAVLVGSDVPGLDRDVAEQAIRALADHDVVLGPARDGGYYLVGLSRPCPDLFRDVAWSTDAVLDTTLSRARALGLTVALLDEKADVDTVADLPAAGLPRP